MSTHNRTPTREILEKGKPPMLVWEKGENKIEFFVNVCPCCKEKGIFIVGTGILQVTLDEALAMKKKFEQLIVDFDEVEIK